jgi:hypothetical protein
MKKLKKKKKTTHQFLKILKEPASGWWKKWLGTGGSI